MKQLRYGMLMFLIAILSACAMAEDEPMEDSVDFRDPLAFQWEEFSFTRDSEYDILYGLGAPFDDFLILRDQTGLESLSTEQESIYQDTFDLFEELRIQTRFEYEAIPQYSSSEFNEFAEAADLELTPADIFTFQAIKTDMEAIQDYYTRIDKSDYVEAYLGRALTTDEVMGFIYLQEFYFELTYYYGVDFDLRTGTILAFAAQVQETLGSPLTTDDQTKMEMALTILQTLLNE